MMYFKFVFDFIMVFVLFCEYVPAWTSPSAGLQDCIELDETNSEQKLSMHNSKVICYGIDRKNCCKIHGMLNEVAGNLSDLEHISDFPQEIDTPPDQNHSLLYGFGRSLVIGIGVILLVLMCIGLSGFCCPIPRRTNIFSTVGRPPTDSGRTTVLTLPVRSSRPASQVHITITNDNITSIHYTPRRSIRAPATEEPPKYEDINALSSPTATNNSSSCPTSDPLLPTYDESRKM